MLKAQNIVLASLLIISLSMVSISAKEVSQTSPSIETDLEITGSIYESIARGAGLEEATVKITCEEKVLSKISTSTGNYNIVFEKNSCVEGNTLTIVVSKPGYDSSEESFILNYVDTTHTLVPIEDPNPKSPKTSEIEGPPKGPVITVEPSTREVFDPWPSEGEEQPPVKVSALKSLYSLQYNTALSLTPEIEEPTSGSSGGSSGSGDEGEVNQGGSNCQNTNWVCEEWSVCTNGVQTTNCQSNCQAKRIDQRACSIVEEIPEESVEVSAPEETSQGFISTITGAVTGNLDTRQGKIRGVIIVILIVLGLLAFSNKIKVK